jgi:ribose transport system substrate-binding protein
LNRLSESKTGLVTTLNSLAAEGESNMKQTLISMKGIASSVDVVKSLIKVINDVAAKTNLLAMNAAIEAAHAGEHGRGFSVVADEIRKLAEQTSHNAGQINQNLLGMVKGIESSTALTVKTDRSIHELVGGIKEVSNSLTEIMAGLAEMSIGTQEITSSLTNLIDITEQVKTDSKLIDDKSTQIDVVMTAVIEISGETMQSMKGFTASVDEIKTASQDISSAGRENSENMDIVSQEVSRFKIIDTSGLKSSDGQDLIQWNKKKKEIPERPANPRGLAESEAGHWHDLEYAGWNTKKVNIPGSFADGAKGKTVILLESCDHPYHTAYKTGCKKLADAFGVKLKSYNADYSPDKQAQQVELAIKDKPDLIIVTPTSVDKSTAWFKAINAKNIPVIGSNTTPSEEGFKYIVGWSGPDDWGQFRLLAREFAQRMGSKGGYGIIRHAVGNSNYFSRTYSVLTELKKVAPQMECLVMETAIKEEDTKALVQKWLQIYGERLKGLCFSDPANGARGMCQAVKEAGRTDMVLVSSGNSTVTQDLVKNGQIHAITYQSAEADGALAMEMAIDWFNGILLEPVRYLPMQIITKENVEKFYPSQW